MPKPNPQDSAKTLDIGKRGAATEELCAELKRRVIGQDTAVDRVVEIVQMQSVGLQAPGRPLASFLFLGPTGTGKTHVVESLAQALLGDVHAVIKVDCAEFQHSHEIAKLIGSPPGYLGHRETHPILSQDALNAWHTDKVKISIVLFDEIEKASDALWNLLLGILDKATLTLGDNRRVDFSRAMIFMTSNLGSKEISNVLNPNLGFAPRGDAPGADVGKAGEGAARRKFTPEFMNRIDRTVVFKPLGPEELRAILQLELTHLQHRLMDAYVQMPRLPRFLLQVSPEAQEWLIGQGTDPRYGARHLKRTIERQIMHPVVNLLTSRQLQDGDVLFVSRGVDEGQPLVFARAAVTV